VSSYWAIYSFLFPLLVSYVLCLIHIIHVRPKLSFSFSSSGCLLSCHSMHSLCICILFGFRFMLYSTLLPTVHSFSHAFVFCPSFCFVYITRYIVQLSGLALRRRRHCPLCSLSSWSFGWVSGSFPPPPSIHYLSSFVLHLLLTFPLQYYMFRAFFSWFFFKTSASKIGLLMNRNCFVFILFSWFLGWKEGRRGTTWFSLAQAYTVRADLYTTNNARPDKAKKLTTSSPRPICLATFSFLVRHRPVKVVWLRATCLGLYSGWRLE